MIDPTAKLTVTVQSTTAESTGDAALRQTIHNGRLMFSAELPPDEGGNGQSPSPFELLYGAWGACTNMTLQVYCRRKGWHLARVVTTLSEPESENMAGHGSHRVIEKRIQVWGDLSDEQLVKLKVIAERCPVNQWLMLHQDNRQITSTIERVSE